ncbi:MAG: pilus assembly PilX N-terminal domain-containing protein [Patescibacteria group bacterium]|nr:pilus assembly PilX N-terminal domain-containing protein [Patescibacteria group bacterium]
MKFFKNQIGGAAILMVVLMLSSIMVVTMSMAEIVRNNLRIGNDQKNSTKAYFAAEAGAEKVIWELRKNGGALCSSNDCYVFDADGNITGCNSDCDSGNEATLSNGAKYMIKYQDPPINLFCYGRFENLRRVIQLIN